MHNNNLGECPAILKSHLENIMYSYMLLCKVNMSGFMKTVLETAPK